MKKQVALLDLSEDEMLIADQILGSLDEDGYFRRDIEAVVDNIAFNYGELVTADKVEKVRKKNPGTGAHRHCFKGFTRLSFMSGASFRRSVRSQKAGGHHSER